MLNDILLRCQIEGKKTYFEKGIETWQSDEPEAHPKSLACNCSYSTKYANHNPKSEEGKNLT